MYVCSSSSITQSISSGSGRLGQTSPDGGDISARVI